MHKPVLKMKKFGTKQPSISHEPIFSNSLNEFKNSLKHKGSPDNSELDDIKNRV